MKRLLILTLLSTPAFAHMVNYDSKAYLNLAKGDSEKANLIAHFCSLAADSVDDCMSRLLKAKGEIAAENCGREIIEISERMKSELHRIGSDKFTPNSGYFHIEEICTKDEGCHRYGYTDGRRETAARELGTLFVQNERVNAAKQQETDTKTKETTGGVKGWLEGSAGMLGTEVKTGIEGSGSNTDSSQKSTVKGGLTEYQIAKAYNAGFVKGWNDPSEIGKYPNILFVKGKSESVGSDGKIYKNDPKLDIPHIPKDLLKDEGPASVNKSKADDKPSTSPLHPTSPAFSTPPSKKGAGLDATNSSDGSWALIQQSDSGEMTPIQACYELEMAKIKKKDAVMEIEGDGFSYAQLKEQAEVELRMGYCNESFYGRDFCNDWHFKKSLNVDDTVTPSTLVEDQPFEEFASFDESNMVRIPESSSPCFKDCPIEVQP